MEKELLNLILFEIREMKGDMSEVKTRLTNVEDRMSNLETDMSEVKGRLTNLEDKMTNVEDLTKFNKDTSDSIRNVVTSHYMEFKKYIKHNDTQHNLYNAKLLQYKKEN